ncbi:MAG TPA: Ig-like domain-containing protein [Chitinophagaceae bacterium]|nr:Ig-like domain-containing protein [Chitinophagaceae bacterium]HNF72142.1 Ig-like domain-containing protein [Chitinophagaceae bacterium]
MKYFPLPVFILLWTSCANIVSPTGGTRDTTAPKLIRRSLPDSATRFTGGTIVFSFDEFIQLKDANQQVVITPLLNSSPSIRCRKNKMFITLPDSMLRPNTTYTLNTGSAISDLHEGNVLENLSATFSTGSYFDSLSLKGWVTEAKSGKPDSAVWVMLYTVENGDSVFLQRKPLYWQKVKADGSFFFRNLPSGQFYLFALQDQNRNGHYDMGLERLAFLNRSLHTGTDTMIQLYTFDAKPESVKTEAKKETDFVKGKQNKTKLNLSFKTNADTVNLAKRSLGLYDSLWLYFNQPLKKVDEVLFRLYQDNTLDLSTQIGYDTLHQAVYVLTNWSPDALYTLKLMKGFVTDSTGADAAETRFSFRTRRASDYGLLKVRITPDTKAMLMLMTGDVECQRRSMQDTLVQFNALMPGDYQLSILHDVNQNKQWDTGDFMLRQQPEIVERIPGTITIKANWENKINLNNPSKK